MNCKPCSIYTNSDCLTPLDAKVLDILIRHALDRPRTFFGLSSTNILRAVHGQGMCGSSRRFTLEEIGEVRRTLLTLEYNGLAYHIKHSKSRWFPTTRAVTAHGFSEGSQTPLGRWL